MTSIIRLKKEFEEISNNPPCNCSAEPDPENMYKWSAVIYGPSDTPYEGGIFKLNIIYPQTYPFKPPKINFITKVYHPNIDTSGNICLDILKDKWSPALTVTKILLSICSLMNEPNPDDPLMPDIANEFSDNLPLFKQNASSWTKIYAQ